MPLSTIPYLEHVAGVYGTIFIGFGVLWFVDAPKALSFFELPYPGAASKGGKGGGSATATAEAKRTVDALGVAYGVRDVFMGAAIYAAAACGTRQALGWIVVAAGCVAGVDGAVCKFMVGKGEMNHWSYAPVLVALGGIMLGAFDWIPVEKVFPALA